MIWWTFWVHRMPILKPAVILNFGHLWSQSILKIRRSPCISLQSLFGHVFRTSIDSVCVSGCSLPLGMQRRLIPDNCITASSFWQSWRNSWTPKLARLNEDGSANAWRPKVPREILIYSLSMLILGYNVAHSGTSFFLQFLVLFKELHSSQQYFSDILSISKRISTCSLSMYWSSCLS